MGTAKRERQKANRQVRLQELAQQARREKSKRIAVRIGLVLVAVVAVVAVAVWLGGDDGGTAATTTTVVYEKPVVSIPEELPTELVVTDLVEGTGDAAATGDTVLVHYVGVRSADGTEFDNSYDSGQPLEVTLGAGMVIEGWEQGLIGVKAGGQRQLDIPADMAYGDSPRGDVIQPGDALTFVVDVVSVTKASATP